MGRMAQPMETFLQRGLANPGHLSFRVLARPQDLGDAGDLEAERSRLDRWAAEQPEQPLAQFNRLPVEEGGPHPERTPPPSRSPSCAEPSTASSATR